MTNYVKYVMFNECIEENVLKDFFTRQKEEGILFQQIATVRKSVLKGKSVELIAEFVDLDIEAVCMIAEYVSGNPAVTDGELVEWYCNNK